MQKVLGMQRGAKVHTVLLFKPPFGFLLPIIVEILFHFLPILFNAYVFDTKMGSYRICILNPFLFI